tara:strand:- start:53 stop:1135 length:1083 start_codon:yes stop_codon:yes gene_type:complete
MIIKKYQSYIYSQFTKIFLFVSLVFFCIISIINIFEEIRFHEKYNTEPYYIIYLSFLNAPAVMFEIFPFIFLISIKFFYLRFSEKNELNILNMNGVSKLKIIYFLSLFSMFLGVFLLLVYYSFSSELKNKYLDIKNSFSNSNEYLAVVNDDGLWIKEEVDNNIFIIHAEKFDKNKLKSLTITETDKYYKNKNTINAEEAVISSKNWQLSNVSILNDNGLNYSYKSYVYNSTFTGEIISNLFSNLNSLNIYELHKLSNSYLKIGYSNTDIKIHLNKIYSMPIFYVLMTILGFVIINKFKKINSKFFTIIFGIFISVLVYYLNYFASLLGNKGVLPIHLSVWIPLLLLFLICNIGLLKVNEN